MNSLPQNHESINFTPDGWPIDPLTGRPYTRDEIVVDETIPYPRHVDPASPGRYWQRRTPAELAEQKARAAKKSQAARKRVARQRRRSRSRRTLNTTVPFALSGAEIQTRRQNEATLNLVKRTNDRPESCSILVTSGSQFSVLEV